MFKHTIFRLQEGQLLITFNVTNIHEHVHSFPDCDDFYKVIGAIYHSPRKRLTFSVMGPYWIREQ